MALAEVTPEMGPMRFINRSHREGPLGSGKYTRNPTTSLISRDVSGSALCFQCSTKMTTTSAEVLAITRKATS